ncbi:HIT domain-containing protein [Asticcacaulis sp. YBE204]|uniref:HIT domain-containing protein n=1 Tax=Asticcacaulis sp. YBE204 TaxID=1282363 RepID=UPI0003C3B4D3|nr:HIT domain-containing protein [Asticcacaulis sp. YBE204]ESQ81031.1 hypothetical protein AEYBE204_01515 [Asticcacaulis sp. YBE204]
MSDFIVDPRIEASSIRLGDLRLCELRLQNDARFPWLVLLPKRAGLIELTDVLSEDDAALWADIRAAEKLARLAAAHLGFPVTKINIANLGNIVAQLHIHIIARNDRDPAWPGPVWGFGQAEPFAPERIDALVQTLKTNF